MGGIGRRLKRLEERAYDAASGLEKAKRWRTDERRAEMIAKIEALFGRMSEPEREAWWDHPGRRTAFEELEEVVEKRLA